MKVLRSKKSAPSVATRKCNTIHYNFGRLMKGLQCFTLVPHAVTGLEPIINEMTRRRLAVQVVGQHTYLMNIILEQEPYYIIHS